MPIYMKISVLLVVLLSLGCSSEQSDTNTTLESPNVEPKQPQPTSLPTNNSVAVETEELFSAPAALPPTIPDGYPRQISLREAELFLSKQTIYGQGCGGMTWDGQGCGMFINDYRGKLQTPWISTPVSVSAMYAQTFDRVTHSLIANFLVELRLDGQPYYRDTPQQLQLVWKPNDESTE